MREDQTDPTQQPDVPVSNLGGRIPFSVAQQLEFMRKELRETLRDRRTIVTLMVMPLVLYPLLGFGLRFLAFQQSNESETEYRVAIETENGAQWLSEALRIGDLSLDSGNASEPPPNIQALVPDDPSQFDLESLVTTSAVDLGVRVQLDDLGANQFRKARVQLYENEASARSRDISRYIERRLADSNLDTIRNWAKQRGQELSVPIEQTRVSLKPGDNRQAVMGLLPLILLLMTVTGGVYPAIDLTAGERERNTMETLMALPVPPFRLLAAKYVAVVAVTMLTGLMNLLAMSVTLYALQLDKSLLGDTGFTVGLVAKLFLALSTFALFYSAVLLLITSSARSFKEAQAYLIPLLLLSLAPGLAVLMPGWSLSSTTAAIPLVNILLLSRELLEGTVQQLPAFVAIISTMLYGAAALSLAARVFGKDAVAFGGRSQWKDLLKRPKSTSHAPSLFLTLSTLASLFPSFFIVSGVVARGDTQPTYRLALSAAMTVVLFVGIPWLLLRWQRVSPVQGLGLRMAAWPYWISASLFGLATWPWVFELVVFANSLGIRGFDPSQIENVDSLLAGWKEVPLWVIVTCLGLVPGICEECFFRGFLFHGLKQHLDALRTIVITSIAFGLFHVVLAGGAAPERILPSTLMGLLLGWVAWQSKSIIPSILLHVVHNSTLLIVVQSRDLLARWNLGQVEHEHLPWWWLASSAAVLVSGAALVYLPRRRLFSPQVSTS